MLSVELFSLGLSLLQVALPLYSMQVFDRVLTSGSTATLLALTMIVGLLLACAALLDALRAQTFVRLANILEARWQKTLVNVAFRPSYPASGASLRDLEVVRACLAGPAMAAVVDLPWTSIFILAIFSLAPLLGWLTLGAAASLLVLAAIGEGLSRRWSRDSQARAGEAQRVLEVALAGRDVLLAMGAAAPICRRVLALRDEAAASGTRSLDRTAWSSAAARGLRSLVQMTILMTATLLVLSEELPPGVILASLMLLTRALSPIERIAASYRQLSAAWQALHRLLLLEAKTETDAAAPISLPPLAGRVEVQSISGRRSPNAAVMLKNISFGLAPGQLLALVGPSGSGKSTLARLLVGALTPTCGTIRLDGATLTDWKPEEVGRQIGFLPQEAQLLDGTVAEIIARFGEVDDAKVVAAAQQVGAHDLILRLPQGYRTLIGRSYSGLSAGERQQIALARALYGEPSLLILDEPISHLDDIAEKKILNVIMAAKERGATMIVVSRLTSILHVADYVLRLDQGRLHFFKPRDQLDSYLSLRLAASHEPAGRKPSMAQAAGS
jgi:PrtD family type I secretion system ABC transporter